MYHHLAAAALAAGSWALAVITVIFGAVALWMLVKPHSKHRP